MPRKARSIEEGRRMCIDLVKLGYITYHHLKSEWKIRIEMERDASAITLYHARGARSFRVLWSLHELKLRNFSLFTMPFPPRLFVPEYLKINLLGTIPLMTDSENPAVRMTESCACPVYLEEKYGSPNPRSLLVVRPYERDYGAYLNWLFHADATLTFPQTLKLRYTVHEPERGLHQAGVDYGKWYIARLKMLDHALDDDRQYLCEDRFTLADICVTYALLLGSSNVLGFDKEYTTKTQKYLKRMIARPAFKAAQAQEKRSAEEFKAGGSKL